jgi:RNA polymerase sigma-70 factor, ECF subfamily
MGVRADAAHVRVTASVNNNGSKIAAYSGVGLGGPAAMLGAPLDRAMSRYAAGDDSAFGEVWAELSPRLVAFIGRLCGSEPLTQDILQETFLRMHRARGAFAKGSPVMPWAYAIARNCFVSHARSRKSRCARESLSISEDDLPAALDASAEETTSARQGAEAVERALHGMSPINRQAFVLTRFEGLSMAAAAEREGTTEAAMKVRVFRAYAVLREALGEMER